jgi:hypothetical protein
MSIGLAFVKGLVGGFSKNIEREREARGAEDARIAELENFVFQAATDPKKRVPEELGNILRDAKQQVADRDPIDIFGRAGDRLNLDMSNLKTMIDEEDAPKFITYGDYKITPVSQNMFEKDFEKNTEVFSRFWLESFDEHFGDGGRPEVEKFMTYMNKPENSILKQKFLKDWTRYTSEYKNRSGKSYTTEGISATKFPNVSNRHISADLLKDLLDDQVLGEDESSIQSLLKSHKAGSSKASQMGVPPLFDEKNMFFLKFSDGSFKPFKFVDEENGLKAKQKLTALRSLAKKNGFGTDAMGLSKFVIAYRQLLQKPLADGTLATIGEEVIASPNAVRSEFTDLFHSINLEHLGAGSKIINMTGSQRANVINYLKTKFTYRNAEDQLVYDKGAAVRALAAVTQVPQSDLQAAQDQDLGVTLTAPNKFADDMFFDTVGIKAVDFLEKYEATRRTVKGIDKLKELKLEEASASGLVAWAKETIGNIVIPTGTLDQLGDFMFGGNSTKIKGTLKKGTTKETLMDIVRRLNTDEFDGTLIKSVGNLSEQQAYMITLAADMARAVDPSGRLSNQDFEVQLRRLGKAGLFQSKIGELSALKQVEDDFKTRLSRIEIIASVLSDASAGGKRLTKAELQVLHANKRYNGLEAILEKAQGETTGKTTGSIPTVEQIENDVIKQGDVELKRYFFIKKRQTDGQGRPTLFYDRKTRQYYQFEYNEEGNIINIKPQEQA